MTTREAFWVWVIRAVYRFSYRRLVPTGGRVPVGIPGMRDPESKCEWYSPTGRRHSIRGQMQGGWFECAGDGHYLCKECHHYTPNPRDE